MELKFKPELPKSRGKIVEDYLKLLAKNTDYDVYTLNDELEIIKCKGKIKNNDAWDYHNNYDDSEDELFVMINSSGYNKRWFSLNREEVEKVQKENIQEWWKMLEEEVTRLTLMTMQIAHRLVTKL